MHMESKVRSNKQYHCDFMYVRTINHKYSAQNRTQVSKARNFVPHTTLVARGCYSSQKCLRSFPKYSDRHRRENLYTLCTNKKTNTAFAAGIRFYHSTPRSCLRIVQPVTYTGFRKLVFPETGNS